MPKGFSRHQPSIQKRTYWLELKRYFPDGDRDELDLGWIELKLKVIDAPVTLYSKDWMHILMKAAANWIDAYRYPKNAGDEIVPNHLFIYDSQRDQVLAQLGLNEFETRDDRVDKIQVDSREPVRK